MESAQTNPTAEEIASLVVKRLVEDGNLNDLANANMMMIEEQTIAQVDQVTRLVMDELLAKQGEQADTASICPKCGKAMKLRPRQHRSLQSRRGQLNFKTDVFHCEACRLDFFPSDENTSV